MNAVNIKSLFERYKSKIRFTSAQSDIVGQIKRLLNGKCPDNEKLFAAEGIWALQKMINAKIDIKSLVICPDYIYSKEAVLLADKIINMAGETFVISKKVFEKLSERDDPNGLISIGVQEWMLFLFVKEGRELQTQN